MMSTATFAEVEAAIRADYELLCREFSLRPVELDIYLVVDDSSDVTALGTCRANATPGYDGRKRIIVLPVEPGDFLVLYNLEGEHPPWTFDRVRWPQWRIELWHEVAHQVQDQRLQMWDPMDGTGGHTKGWFEALDVLGRPFGVAATDMDKLLI